MTSTLVDSNVLIDVFDPSSAWYEWSQRRLHDVRLEGSLIVNVIVASEVARGFRTEAKLESALSQPMFVREDVPWRAAFLSSMAHAEYRKRGGVKERVLPDFLIGAHALAAGHRLLTRDGARYRTYFPALDIIAPDSHP